MSDADRDELIDAYFEAMDAEDTDVVHPILADDFVFESLSGPLEGFSGFEEYMHELRGLSDTEHEISLRIHGEDASVAEGTVTGQSEDGGVEVDFCDVFEFDDDGQITRIAVYLNDV